MVDLSGHVIKDMTSSARQIRRDASVDVELFDEDFHCHLVAPDAVKAHFIPCGLDVDFKNRWR